MTTTTTAAAANRPEALPAATRPAAPRGRRRARRRAWPRLVAGYVLTILAVVTIVFFIPRAMPGDPLAGYTLADETGYAPSEADMAALRSHYGLDRPLLEQYTTYLGRLTRGDLGTSISYDLPVRTLLRRALPWTLLLVGTALALSALLSFTAGVAAAWRRGGPGDRLTTVMFTALNTVPDYALAMLVVILFGGVLELFPIAGATSTDTAGLGLPAKAWDAARHLALPAGALTFSLIGVKYLLVRNTMISVLGQDYMVLARAKGLPERLLKYRHAGRNALLPFLNIVGVQVGVAVGSAVFVESVFAYPGIGGLIVPAVGKLDYPLIEGGFLLVAVFALTANLLVDLVSALVDPRVAR